MPITQSRSCIPLHGTYIRTADN